MASGFDSYKNGLLFGALFGVVALAYALSAGSYIAFLGDWMAKLTTWLTTQTWFPASLNFAQLNYVLAGLIGAIVGIYIDKA